MLSKIKEISKNRKKKQKISKLFWVHWTWSENVWKEKCRKIEINTQNAQPLQKIDENWENSKNNAKIEKAKEILEK